jgi:Ca2+-binding EF-hand superfamily protein
VIVLHPNEINTSRKEIFVAGMLRTFDEADKDGDGNMDFVEFLRQQWEGRPELTYRDSNLRQMRREFRKLDLNRDGKISRQEFITMAENCFDKNN